MWESIMPHPVHILHKLPSGLGEEFISQIPLYIIHMV